MKRNKSDIKEKKIYELQEKLSALKLVYNKLKPAEQTKNLEKYKKIEEKINEELSQLIKQK